MLCAALTAAGMVYVFAFGHSGEPASYAVYLFSAYSLMIAVTALVRRIRPIIAAALHNNPLLHRYLTDVPFRTVVMLYWSLAVGVLYAVMKFVMGVYYRSNWFITLALYYLILTLMRFLLLRGSHVRSIGIDLVKEYRQYRRVGAVLLLMNFALTGIVLLYVRQNQSFHYAGTLIFAMAAYAFYSVIMAIRAMVVYRRHGSPVLSAATVIGFAATLITMLALETAMLSQFGLGNDAAFRHTMVAATGGVISIVFIATAVYMMLHATKELKRLDT